MSDVVKSILNDLEAVFTATDNALEEYNGPGKLQVPVLVEMVALKLNWDEKQTRVSDPLIRFFLKKNPDWTVSRGARGGIERTTDKLKKDSDKKEKQSVKNQLKAQIEAKTSPVNIVTNTSTTVVNTSTEEDVTSPVTDLDFVNPSPSDLDELE